MRGEKWEVRSGNLGSERWDLGSEMREVGSGNQEMRGGRLEVGIWK